MSNITVWGFSGSTFTRTVRMQLAEKGADYKQVPVDVLAGEPKQPEHLARHPFGKIPVVDVDNFRVYETPSILRYLEAVLPGPSLIPGDPKHVARMDTIISIIDSYGYVAMVGGITAYHLFPDYVGGKNEEFHKKGLADGKLVMTEIIKLQGDHSWLAGPEISLADLYVAPVFAYVSKTPHKEEFLALPGVKGWWDKISARESFTHTDF